MKRMLLIVLLMFPGLALADDDVVIITAEGGGREGRANSGGPVGTDLGVSNSAVVSPEMAEWLSRERALRLHADTLRSLLRALEALRANQQKNLDDMGKLLAILRDAEKAARAR